MTLRRREWDTDVGRFIGVGALDECGVPTQGDALRFDHPDAPTVTATPGVRLSMAVTSVLAIAATEVTAAEVKIAPPVTRTPSHMVLPRINPERAQLTEAEIRASD